LRRPQPSPPPPHNNPHGPRRRTPLRRGPNRAQAVPRTTLRALVFALAQKRRLPPSRGVLRQSELIEKVRSYDPDADEGLINRAYVFSMKAHGAQLRASGDPYFSHPIEVAG